MNDKCTYDCCNDCETPSLYDDMIAQLKETRNSIDKMIQTLEQRKVKDSVINHILSTEYEDPDDIKKSSEDTLRDILKNMDYTNYTIIPKRCYPYTNTIYYPYYFKF